MRVRLLGAVTALVFVVGEWPQIPLSPARAAEAVGVRVPEGFEATLYADDDLAHDIFSMTLDAQGRVVVASRGYVRILIDNDGDGVADSFKQFADAPRSGAQGMCFDGADLLCTGDGGLLRFRDADHDDRADGPPELLLKLKTGGEHHTHAVRKGPDGWWYVIAGNGAGVNSQYVTLPSSPIQRPRSGTILRIKPDFSASEVIADGFRNAYDFDFNAAGDLFVYDSDGERDVSLPWYRPTRVFHALPGSNAGWVSRSWKRPGYFADMPPVVAAFGRGSPTGVVCYRHEAFPRKYHNAVFALDWTFGRVLATPLEADGSVWKSEPVTFMTGVGQFGFAPTDAVVGPDGELYVSVGGRGARGGVYRVTYKKENKPEIAVPDAAGLDQRLLAALSQPQPLEAWSRARWSPVVEELGRAPLAAAALNETLPPRLRVRAIEILTEKFSGLTSDALEQLIAAKPAAVRARAVWSWGKTASDQTKPETFLPFLEDEHPLVVRFALEALQARGEEFRFEPLTPVIAKRLNAEDRFVRQTAARIVPRLGEADRARIATLVLGPGTPAMLFEALGRAERADEVDLDALLFATGVLERGAATELKLLAARVSQLALGGLGPFDKPAGKNSAQEPPVFDGYHSRFDLAKYQRYLDVAGMRVAKAYPSGSERLDYELARLAAMLAPKHGALLETTLGKISDKSPPADDTHFLIVAARLPTPRSDAQREQIATALVRLQAKIDERKLHQDNNWEPRVGELYRRLTQLDSGLPAAVIDHREFGLPGHTLFADGVPPALQQQAIAAFVRRITTTEDYPWTTDMVYLLAKSDEPQVQKLLREQYSQFAVRDAVRLVLARRPLAADRAKFVEGLESSQLDTLTACLRALEKLPPAGDDAIEQFALLARLAPVGRRRSGVCPARGRGPAVAKKLGAGV